MITIHVRLNTTTNRYFVIRPSSTVSLILLSADHEIAPAQEAAFYHTIIPDAVDFGGDMGPFTGNPSPEIDLAWKQLLSRK